jgi:hypothetical protein
VGYGEFGGGGSLQWQMTHTNRKVNHVPQIPGKKQQGEGIDPDVSDGDDLLVVINGGTLMLSQPGGPILVRVKLTNKTDVQLKWGTDAASMKQYLDALSTSEERLKEIAPLVDTTPTGI